MDQPQTILVEVILRGLGEAREAAAHKQAVGPCAASGDADPTALAVLHKGVDMDQTKAASIEVGLRGLKEGGEAGRDPPSARPGTGAGDTDPLALAVLHEGGDVHQAAAVVVEEILRGLREAALVGADPVGVGPASALGHAHRGDLFAGGRRGGPDEDLVLGDALVVHLDPRAGGARRVLERGGRDDRRVAEGDGAKRTVGGALETGDMRVGRARVAAVTHAAQVLALVDLGADHLQLGGDGAVSKVRVDHDLVAMLDGERVAGDRAGRGARKLADHRVVRHAVEEGDDLTVRHRAQRLVPDAKVAVLRAVCSGEQR